MSLANEISVMIADYEQIEEVFQVALQEAFDEGHAEPSDSVYNARDDALANIAHRAVAMLRSQIQPDFTCAECGRAGAGSYVVTVLDAEDVKATRTEVCLGCHRGLSETS